MSEIRKVLIVDDLPEARALLRDAVNEAFPEAGLYFADSLRAGFDTVTVERFDLALVDLALGDGHGTHLIQHLCENQPDCTAVVASVMGDDENLFRALQAGASGYLLKDQAKDQLVFQLSGIAEGSLPLSPSIARKLMRHFQVPGPCPNAEEACLSPRELEVLGQLAQGIRLVDIADRLAISRHTVGDHVKKIYRKLNISSRAEAALKAQSFGLTGRIP